MTARGLTRKTPLRRTGGLKRTPMKRVNKERKARRDAEAFGEQAELCRRIPCVVCWDELFGQPTGAHLDDPEIITPGCSEPHHIPTRGAGGIDKDTVPLCRAHHQEWHDAGEQTFADKYGVDLRAVAASLCEELKNNE